MDMGASVFSLVEDVFSSSSIGISKSPSGCSSDCTTSSHSGATPRIWGPAPQIDPATWVPWPTGSLVSCPRPWLNFARMRPAKSGC